MGGLRMQMSVPTYNSLTGTHKAADVEGDVVCKAFLVHRPPGFSLYAWRVTHISTGHVAADAKTKKAAIHAARRLAKLGDWTFTDPETVKQWPTPVQERIRFIRDAARRGVVACSASPSPPESSHD